MNKLPTTLVRSSRAFSLKRGATSCIAIFGIYDGLHRGHQELILRAKKYRQEMNLSSPIVLVTLYPHPSKVLTKREHTSPLLPVLPLTTPREQLLLLGYYGVDEEVALHFNEELSTLSGEEFVRAELFDKLNIRHLIVGADARVGYRGHLHTEGIVEEMRRCGGSGEVVSFVCEHRGNKISSRSIRTNLSHGELPLVQEELGRPWGIVGRVIHGDQRGRTLGFSTANIRLGARLLPPLGVYATVVSHRGTLYPAVSNLGIRPTFGSDSGVLLESHLIGYEGEEFYGERIAVFFLAHLRAEVRFESLEKLVSQITADKEKARILATPLSLAGRDALLGIPRE